MNTCSLIDAQTVAEKYGIEVKIGDFEDYNILGLVKRSKNKDRIIVNSASSIEDQNYTIAHQMAHLCLGHINYDDYRIDTFKTIYRRHQDKQERYANEFADIILIPKTLIISAIEFGLTDIKSLANIFKVNKMVMKNRLIRLNII